MGSNHVVFGGMILPVSAISINCFIVTGYKAKATFISPLSTRRFNSPRPRIPPTKSIRLSEHPHDHAHLHADGAEHTHSHDCGQDCASCASTCEHTPMEELVALMKYMVGHNAAHAKELADLAVQLDKAGDHTAYEQVMAAVSDFEKGNMRLSVVLSSLEVK